MHRIIMAVAVLAFGAATAEAGPWRRTTTTTRASTCVGGACSTASSRTVTRGGGAQAHAEAMAASGSLVHAASHPGFEGVGVGGSPQAARAACCTNGGTVIDEGVAYGHGRWWACVRRR
jgi:hypothetical protein